MENNGQFPKGHKRGMFGHKHSEKTRLKLHLVNKGKKLTEITKKKIGFAAKGNQYRKGKIPWNKDRKYTDEEKVKFKNSGQFQKGSKGHWKGGITPILQLLRACFQYKEWRQKVFIRDDFTCQRCNARGVFLHVHHKKSFKKLLEEIKTNLPLFNLYDAAMIYSPLWDVENGITLCRKCHYTIKRKV